MARIETYHQSFNVGVFDRNALHRTDLEKPRLAAERQTNFLCDAVGRATLRAGFEFMSSVLGTGKGRMIPFIAGSSDAFQLIMADEAMYVLDGQTDELVSRVAVSTAITSGDFSASTGWTLASTSGQTTTVSGGTLNLTARAHGGKATALQQVTVAGADQNVEHALRIVVSRGPVMFRCGSTSGGEEYIAETALRAGEHSLAFTPTGDFYVQFSSELPVLKMVNSITVEAAGNMSLPTLWAEADLDLIRVTQSLDVMFCAAAGYKRQRIERRSDTSWSVCDYDTDDGPFMVGRSANVRLKSSVLEGNGTLTAEAPFFDANMVGAIFQLTHEGQQIDTYLAGDNQFSKAFLLSGITETNFEERKFTVVISGTWVGTLKHQRSFDGEFGQYHEYRREQASATINITGNATYTNDDNDDNAEVWVKMGFEEGDYTSGEARVRFTYQGGYGYGICRVVGFTSSTVVDIEVLRPFMGTHYTEDWREGRYSAFRGHPSAVALSDGRLDWAGSDQFDGSISDAYEAFDENFAGDSGPLSRAIALGGRNEARWMLPLTSLMIGCDSRVANVRASSLDEILTPSNFGMKTAGSIGCASISPVELADDRGLFVHNSGNALYEVVWSNEKGRYITSPFSKINTELFASGIKNMAVQTLPDQRIWVPIVDSNMVCIVFEPTQNVIAAHIPIATATGDYFEDVSVLPGTDQGRVYVIVRRAVGGQTVRYIEKMALDTEALPGDICKVMDSHVVFGAGSATITGLDHLEGRDVVVWMDGEPVTDATITDPAEDDAKVFTVSGGSITLDDVPATGGCVGLAYDGQYKSARLAYGIDGYTPVLKNKSLAGVGLLLSDYCRSGVKWGAVKGSGFEARWSLPDINSSTGTTADEIVEGPGDDEDLMQGGSPLDLDIRLCVTARSPKPLTMRSIVMAVETKG